MNKLLSLLLLFSLPLTAQVPEAANWNFGNGLSLNFVNGEVVLNGGRTALNAPEGSVSISDSLGNLLFYTNGGPRVLGGEVLDSGFVYRADGGTLLTFGPERGGGASARQSGIAFAEPGGTGYYLFTTDERESTNNKGLRFILLGASAGGVEIPDDRGLIPAFEGLTATPMANDSGFWVLSHAGTTTLNATPVTAAGVDFAATVRTFLPNAAAGLLRLSPDGTQLWTNGFLYTFDPAAGTAGNVLAELPTLDPGSVSFTADSRFLYGRDFSNDVLGGLVVRYDTEDFGRRRDVARLEVEPGTVNRSRAPFQIGPDYNLYTLDLRQTGNQEQLFLYRVSCASTSQPVYEEVLELPVTGEASPTFNLPNFVDALFRLPFSPDTVALPPLVLRQCAADVPALTARAPGTAYRWTTGDTTATILPTASGTYVVTITDENECRPVVDTQQLTIVELPELTVRSIPAGAFCPGDTVTFFLEAGTARDTIGSTVVTGAIKTFSLDTECGPVTATFTYPDDCPPPVCRDQIPTIITPNADGRNDGFRLFTNCREELTDFTLVISNRWGQKVFTSNNPGDAWDGTIDGTAQNMGTYYYQMAFRYPGREEMENRNGEFTLVR